MKKFREYNNFSKYKLHILILKICLHQNNYILSGAFKHSKELGISGDLITQNAPLNF